MGTAGYSMRLASWIQSLSTVARPWTPRITRCNAINQEADLWESYLLGHLVIKISWGSNPSEAPLRKMVSSMCNLCPSVTCKPGHGKCSRLPYRQSAQAIFCVHLRRLGQRRPSLAADDPGPETLMKFYSGKLHLPHLLKLHSSSCTDLYSFRQRCKLSFKMEHVMSFFFGIRCAACACSYECGGLTSLLG